MFKLNRLFPLLITVVILQTPSRAEVFFGKDTLIFNHGINFTDTGGSVVDWAPEEASGCGEPIDLFYRDVERCCLALGCNCGFRLGASGAFYRSYIPFADFNFHGEMDLNSSGFSAATTESPDDEGGWMTCPGLHGFFEPSTNGPLDFSNYVSCFFIVKNRSQQYVLFRLQVLPAGVIQGNSEHEASSPIEISWWLQTDGSTDFSKVQMARTTTRPSARYRLPAAVGFGTGIYNLKGIRLSSPRGVQGVYIVAPQSNHATKGMTEIRVK